MNYILDLLNEETNIINLLKSFPDFDLQKCKYISSRELLLKKGKIYLDCVFHLDNECAFKIDVVSNSYKCKGCGASGDRIKLVQEYGHMSLKEACKYIMDKGKKCTDNKTEKEEPLEMD